MIEENTPDRSISQPKMLKIQDILAAEFQSIDSTKTQIQEELTTLQNNTIQLEESGYLTEYDDDSEESETEEWGPFRISKSGTIYY